jgi:hypothetical protein
MSKRNQFLVNVLEVSVLKYTIQLGSDSIEVRIHEEINTSDILRFENVVGEWIVSRIYRHFSDCIGDRSRTHEVKTIVVCQRFK